MGSLNRADSHMNGGNSNLGQVQKIAAKCPTDFKKENILHLHLMHIPFCFSQSIEG